MAKIKQAGPARVGLSAGLVGVALALLCNPNFHLLDLLPDVIGYLLLLIAFRRLSPADESFREAARGFGRLAWLSLARMVGLVWVYSATSAAEQPTLTLCIVFALGVLELMVIFPTCTQLFRGLAYRATRLDGKAVFAPAGARKIARLQRKLERARTAGTLTVEREARINRSIRRLSRRGGGDMTDRACFSCQLFALVKTALCVLPELTALADASYREGVTLFNWYAYANGFRAIAHVVGLVIGIIWLVKLLRYYAYIAKDIAFWNGLEQHCRADATAHPERRPAMALRVARVALIVGAVFVLNFYMEGVNYLPGFLTPVAFLVALTALWRYLPRKLALGVGAVQLIHLGWSFFFYIRVALFLGQYDNYAIVRDWNVRDAYYEQVVAPAWVESALTLISLATMGLVLLVLVDRYVRPREHGTYLHSAEELAQAKVTRLKWSLIRPGVLGFLACGIHIAYYMVWYQEGRAWVQDVLFGAAFVLVAALRVCAMFDQIDAERMAEISAMNE